MTAPLSGERLAEIREREQAATEGPWVRWTDQENIPGWDGFFVVGDNADEGEECNPAARVYIESDAEFIAHAREDVPVLLAEVEQLRTRLARAEHVMRRALNEVEHDEVVHLLHRYLSDPATVGSPS